MTVESGRNGVRNGPFWAVACTSLLILWTSSVEARRPPSSARAAEKSSVAPSPESGGFSLAEQRRLLRGKSVKRRFEVVHQGDTYQAGLSYRLVEGTPMDVIRVLRKPGAIVKVIPYGVSATVLSEKDGVSVITISQGKRPVVGSYTVRMKWDLRSNSARFWMDPAFQADIEDIWGTFSAREVRPGLTLVSFGFAFNIRGVASILERKAQSWGLTTADRIAKYVNGTRTPMLEASRL